MYDQYNIYINIHMLITTSIVNTAFRKVSQHSPCSGWWYNPLSASNLTLCSSSGGVQRIIHFVLPVSLEASSSDPHRCLASRRINTALRFTFTELMAGVPIMHFAATALWPIFAA